MIGSNKSLIFLTAVFFFLDCIIVESNACPHKRFNVVSYGNDNAAITRLVSDVNKNKGGRIVFPANETYVLSIKDDSNSGHRLLPHLSSVLFSFQNCKYLDIDLNGSTIILDNNHSSKYSVFYFYNCQKLSLRNGQLIGDAERHDYTSVIYKGRSEESTHEWGHGVMIMGSKGTISNLHVSWMTGDGIYVASYKDSEKVMDSQISIVGCDISFCRRNGITCASNTGFELKKTVIQKIGSYGKIIGTNPRAGIDFEYEDGIGNKGDILISECTIKDCEGKTITSSNVFVPRVSSFRIEKCTLSGSSFQIANVISDREKIVRDCHFYGTSINCGNSLIERCRFLMGSKLYYVHGTSFSECEFEGSLHDLSGPYGCAIVGNSLDKAYFENCVFRNIRGINTTSSSYQGFSGYSFPLLAYFKSCKFSNTSFVKGNPKIESSFFFDDCVLSDGCMIYNEGGPAVLFRNSTVDNVGSYPTQKGEFSFENCEIIQNDETVRNPLLFFGTHSLKNSSVKNSLSITQKMREMGVREIKIMEIDW